MHSRVLRIGRRRLLTIRPLPGTERAHALEAYLDGDPNPAGFAELVCDPKRASAEIAVAVARPDHRRRIADALVDALAGDARAAGIRVARVVGL